MSLKVLLVIALSALALALPQHESYGQPPAGMPYDFSYAVKDDYTGNDYAHEEKSDGIITSGSYRVLLPDGRTQVVTFSADYTNGYQAEVAYEGEAQYDHPQPAYA